MSSLQRRHFPHNINILIACAGFSGKLTQRWLSTGRGCSAARLWAQAVLRGAVNAHCHLKERNLQENGKQLPLLLSELIKTKSLNLLFAACLFDAFRRAVSQAKRDKSHHHHLLSAAGLGMWWSSAQVRALGNFWNFSNFFVCVQGPVAGQRLRCSQVLCQGRAAGLRGGSAGEQEPC